VAVFTKNTFAIDSTQTYTVLSTTLGEMSNEGVFPSSQPFLKYYVAERTFN